VSRARGDGAAVLVARRGRGLSEGWVGAKKKGCADVCGRYKQIIPAGLVVDGQTKKKSAFYPSPPSLRRVYVSYVGLWGGIYSRIFVRCDRFLYVRCSIGSRTCRVRRRKRVPGGDLRCISLHFFCMSFLSTSVLLVHSSLILHSIALPYDGTSIIPVAHHQ
jgi:hypothetical protein